MNEIIILRNVLKLENRPEVVDNNKVYKILGVRWYAKGLFIKYEKKGSEIKSNKLFLVKKGDFVYSRLFAWKGSFSLAYDEHDGCYASNEFPCLRVDNGKLDSDYLMWYFSQKDIWDEIDNLSEGSTGISRNRLKIDKLLSLSIPFKSIDEQKKISKRLNSFFNEFNQNIGPLKEEIKNNIKLLRQSILQEAVQGKLVPQDPNDLPASELLKEIQKERVRLIKEKKIKKQKPLPSITEEETPYTLPPGWSWVRLDQIAQNIHYGFTSSADFNKKDIKLLRITDIQNNKVNWNNVPGCNILKNKLKNYELNKGDILIARTGGTIGKTYIVDNLEEKAVFASYLIRVIPSNFINKIYLKKVLESPIYWQQLFEKSKGTGQPNVNATSLKLLKVSLPPLNEQKRIVKKADELMAFCDELEKNINETKKYSEMLIQSVLKEVFKEK